MNISHDLFNLWAVHSGLVLLKTMLMSFWTVQRRYATKTFASPEDIKGKEGATTVANDEVERVKRSHQNDLENVIPFVFLGFIYISTGPAFATAKMVFRIFTVTRYLHSVAYVCLNHQPIRTLCFLLNMMVNLFMTFGIITKCLAHF